MPWKSVRWLLVGLVGVGRRELGLGIVHRVATRLQVVRITHALDRARSVVGS
jgi:hypothetical protein